MLAARLSQPIPGTQVPALGPTLYVSRRSDILGFGTDRAELTVETLTRLPEDLSIYHCVAVGEVPYPRLERDTEFERIRRYVVEQGGTLIGYGDHGELYPPGTRTLNALTARLGTGMRLRSIVVDPLSATATENFETTQVAASPLTAGIASLEYAAVDGLDVSPPAQVLAKAQSAPFRSSLSSRSEQAASY